MQTKKLPKGEQGKEVRLVHIFSVGISAPEAWWIHGKYHAIHQIHWIFIPFSWKKNHAKTLAVGPAWPPSWRYPATSVLMCFAASFPCKPHRNQQKTLWTYYPLVYEHFDPEHHRFLSPFANLLLQYMDMGGFTKIGPNHLFSDAPWCSMKQTIQRLGYPHFQENPQIYT